MEALSARLLLSALRARFGVFAFVLAVTVVAAAAVSLALPKTYRASVSVLVDAKEEQSLSNALRPFVAPQERMGYLQTQVDIMSSRKVAQRAVEELKLASQPALREKFREQGGGGSIEDWIAEGLLQNLKVDTSQSSVMNITYVAQDPRFAAAVANAFANGFVATVLELRVEPQRQASQWFDEQLKNLRANLEKAQARLTDYHQSRGIVAAEERFDVESTRLDALSQQLARAQEQTFELRSRERQAREMIEAGGPLERVPQVSGDGFIQKLKSDLLAADLRLRDARNHYGERHPEVAKLRAERDALQGRLAAESRNVVANLSSAVRQSQQRDAELRAAIAEQRDRVLGMKESRNELSVLQRDVESAQRAYEAAMQRAVVTQVDSRASQSNVAVLSPATVPVRPHRPRIRLNVALAAALGAMLGLALATILELLDRRVRSVADLRRDPRSELASAASQVPVLATLSTRPRAELRLLARPGPLALPRAG